MQFLYRAIVEADPDGGFLVTFPDVPEAITFGVDRADALSSAGEALGLALRGYVLEDKSLPLSTEGEGVWVPVGMTDALKLAVIGAFRSTGISKVEFARRLGKAETEARRILDPDYPSKLPTLERALAALGKSAVIEVRNAA